MVVAAVAPSLALVWYADTLGYFNRNGLDLSITVNTSATTSLVSGQADLGLSGATTGMTLAKQGVQTSFIYTNGDATIGGSAVGLPSVKSIAQCSRMSVFPIGSTAYGYAADEKKLYGTNYSIVPMSTTVQDAGLAAGTVDCGIADESTWGSLLTSGKVHLLVDPRKTSTLPKGFPTHIAGWGFWGIKSTLQAHRTEVVDFLKGINQAWTAYKKMSSLQVAAVLCRSPDLPPISAQHPRHNPSR